MPREFSLNQYVRPSPERLDFMTEVARIAVHHGIRQAELAERYNEATESTIQSFHVKRHFQSKVKRKKVIDGYADALKMPKRYVELLMDPRSLLPRDPKAVGSRVAIARYLRPELVEPLFDDGAVAEAIRTMLLDAKLREHCLYEAELAGYRFESMPRSEWVPELRIDPDALEASRADGKTIAKWAAVAKLLKAKGKVNLASRIRQKDVRTKRQEELLAKIWDQLSSVLNDDNVEKPYAKDVQPSALRWDEWRAVESVLEMIFNRRGWPVETMLKRLHADPTWKLFDDELNPAREEEGHESLPDSAYEDRVND